MTIKIDAAQFKDAKYMTAAEKALTVRQWRTFLKALALADTAPLEGADYGYFPKTLDRVFPDRVYKFLSLYAGFIAHYNRRGFLSARFSTYQNIWDTFAQLRQRQYFGGHYAYADIGAAFVREIETAMPLFAARLTRERAHEEQAEREQLARLKEKYPA